MSRRRSDRKRLIEERKRLTEARERITERRESAKRSAWNLIGILAIQLVLAITALTSSAEDRVYNKAHGSLFFVSVLILLPILVILAVEAERLQTMLGHTWQTTLRPGQATLPQVVDALRLLSLVVALASIAFIVDLALVGRGFTIGGSITVSLILLGKAFMERWRATRR